MSVTPGLLDRIRRQGWAQGCLLTWRVDSHVASTGSGRTVSFAELGEGQLILISQQCDLVAPKEPFCFAIPLEIWDQSLPRPNSSRYFVVDASRSLVANQTQIVQIEKALLPDTSPTQLLAPTRRRAFAAWCARRWSRYAFPDEFNRRVGGALAASMNVLGTPDQHEATHSWRANLLGYPRIAVLAVYDETACDETGYRQFAAEVERQTNVVLEADSDFRVSVTAISSRNLSVFDASEYPPLAFEDLTYGGEASGDPVGGEPHEEFLA